MAISEIPPGLQKELNNRITTLHKQVETARRQEEEKLNTIRDTYEKRTAAQNEKNQRTLEEQKTSGYHQVQNLRRNQREELSQIANDLNERIELAHTEADQKMDQLQESMNEKIMQVRKDNLQKLSAYASRKNDPFYRPIEIHANLKDEGEYFELTATIPKHEQKNIKVSLKGDNIMISGSRRTEEDLELDPGHRLGSATFQTFHESFPLSWPVESAQLSKTFDGDQLIIRVPKKNEYAFVRPQPKAPEKIK